MSTSPAQTRTAPGTGPVPRTATRPGRSLPLHILGSGADSASERGVNCPGELPPASDPALVARATTARKALGERAFILGHHYQRDEVIQFADVTGDSYKLARDAAGLPKPSSWCSAVSTSWPSRQTS